MTRAAPTQAKPKRWLGVHPFVLLFLLALLLPTAVSLNAGSLRLSVYRVVLIIAFVPMLMAMITGKAGRVTLFDYLIFGHGFWATLALMAWGGFVQGIESGGIYVAEVVGAYLLGRVYIRSYEDFCAFARLLVYIVLATLPFTIPEALTSVHILYDGIAALVGGPSAPFIEPRMGLERTFGSFDHPILYGVFSASAFSLAYFVIADKKIGSFSSMWKVGGIGLATFMSASGGPYVVLMMQIFIAGWEKVWGNTQGRWAALFSLFALIYIGIDLFSNRSPFHVFVTYFTFSTTSAYNRILIFEYGMAEVFRHPLLGIGLGDWVRPPWMSDSMDNFWLLIAVRYGVPAWAMFLGTLLGMVWAVAHRQNLPEPWRRARHAWAFTLFGITVAAATVHLWNALFVLFMLLIGSGGWLLDAVYRRKWTAQSMLQNMPVPPAPLGRLF
jgi:hypothetical protein